MCYALKGNSYQVQKQSAILEGLDVETEGVYSMLRSNEDYIKALKLIYDKEPEGWENYTLDFLDFGICSTEELAKKISNSDI